MVCHCVACGAELVTQRDGAESLLAVLARYFGYQLDGPDQSWEEHMSISRRNKEEAGNGPLPPPADMATLDLLWSFLSDSFWAEGDARQLGSVTLFVDQGRLKAALNDRDAGEVGFVTLEHHEPLWAQLDQSLRSERIDWRRSGRKGR